MRRYNNYHKHTHYSNIRTLDCVVKPIDYIERAKELGHTTYFTTEHGFGGNVFEAYTLCKDNNLKCIFAVEAYYVDNRHEKDRGNYHIVLVAKNNQGFKDINRVMSEANKNGYYYKPRIDLELLLSLNPKNVIITTACVAGRLFKSEDYEEKFLIPVMNHFKDNFYLEVQNHNEEVQINYNKQILEIAEKYDISLIHANDSHYILPSDSLYRDKFLQAKGIRYSDEGNFILDYPNYDEIVERYEIQDVLSNKQIEEALNNTLIFDECEDLEFTKDIKLPKIHKDKNSNELLKTIVARSWKKEKKQVIKDKIKEYEKAIRFEMNIIQNTKMEDYFILDYEIVDRAINVYNATLTKTGRGSSPSFYINKLLGLTDIDRISAPVTLYPTRFMSETRILKTVSLPDIDLNWSSVEPVIKASKDILGEDGIYQMVAYKPLQKSSAFRLWCKANNMKISEYDEVAKSLASKDETLQERYLNDEYWNRITEESKHFRGVIESIAPSPCSYLLLDKPIPEEVGLVKVGDIICCCLDGYQCDQWKFLKNDYLIVTVWDLIDKTYKMINKTIPSIRELNELLDEKTFELYEDGITATLNQADSDFATPLVKRYAPKSVAEMSAWVAAIRPGFKSLLDNFLHRKSYTTGVKELDVLLEDSFHYLMYQESIMKYLVWLGVPEDETYGIIKKIAKKKFKEDELEELKSQLLNGWIKNVGKEEGFQETWQVVEDAAKYSFNASHSLSVGYDSLYGAYAKSHYPLEYYTVCFNSYQGDIDKTTKLTSELEYFNIALNPPKFGYSAGEYTPDKATNSIYKGIGSIKFCNNTIGQELYDLKDNTYNNFLELLLDIIEKTSCNSRQIGILIKLGFFDKFGKTQYLYDIFEKFQARYKKTHKDTTKQKRIEEIKEYIETLENKEMSVGEIVSAELEYLGYISYTDSNFKSDIMLITQFKKNSYGTPFATLYRLCDGKTTNLKINKSFYDKNPIQDLDLIQIVEISKRNKRRKVDGKWIVSDEVEHILSKYSRVVE